MLDSGTRELACRGRAAPLSPKVASSWSCSSSAGPRRWRTRPFTTASGRGLSSPTPASLASPRRPGPRSPTRPASRAPPNGLRLRVRLLRRGAGTVPGRQMVPGWEAEVARRSHRFPASDPVISRSAGATTEEGSSSTASPLPPLPSAGWMSPAAEPASSGSCCHCLQTGNARRYSRPRHARRPIVGLRLPPPIERSLSGRGFLTTGLWGPPSGRRRRLADRWVQRDDRVVGPGLPGR